MDVLFVTMVEQAVNSAGDNERPEMVVSRLEAELGVNEWWSPGAPRRPEHSGPRVTEDGLKVPAWWTDDETESQRMLAAQGVMLDG